MSRLMKRPFNQMSVLLAPCLALVLLPLAACAEETPSAKTKVHKRPGTIQVTATGETTTVPDVTEIVIGVTTQAETAAGAMSTNTARMQKVMAALRQAGVADKDLQTSGLSVRPRYTQPPRDSNAAPKIEGYDVTNQVTARLRDMDRVGRTLDEVIDAGANNIHSIRFTVAEPEPLLDQARSQAVTRAIARADLYAKAAGIKRGRILKITEAGSYEPRPMMVTTMRAEAVPIAPGEQTLTASVTIVFAIDR